MAVNKGFARNAQTDAIDARLMDAELFMRNQDGSVRTGILQTLAPGGAVVTATTSMNVAVASADFVLSRGAGDGAYRISNQGIVNVTLDTAPSANSRLDAIYVKQNDATVGDVDAQGQALNTSVIGKVTGTAQASPTVPAIPTGALLIATVLVPANVTATNAAGVVLSNVAQFTAVVGGTLQYRTLALANADRTNTAIGTYATVTGTPTTYRNDGTAWRLWEQPATDITLAFGSGAPSKVNLGTTGSQLFSFSVAAGIARLDFRLRAAGSGMTWGDIRYVLPVPAYSTFGAGTTVTGMGVAMVSDANGGQYGMWVGPIGDGTWRVWRTGADFGSSAGWDTSPPFALDQGDTITGTFSYPAA